jgi:hypothetical protein
MSKPRTHFFLWLVLLIASPISGLLHAQQVDARQIVQRVYEQAALRSIEMRASLVIYDRQGNSTKKEFLYRRINTNPGSKTRVDMISPAEEKGVVLLAMQQGLSANQYVYTPATDRVRSLGPQDRTARFLGSDFIFDDFADRNPADFTYRLISDSEKIDGQETYKIESRPVEQGSSPYAYVYLWVAKNAPVIVYAQMYTAPGVMTRVLHATELRHESGVWGMRRTEVSTAVEHTRTVLTVQSVKLNPSLDDAAFSSQKLGSAAPVEKK